MSWLNLNDSISNLKGQLSNFANNVLADEDQQKGASSSNAELEELQKICNKQQEEIDYLQKINSEMIHERNTSVLSKDGFSQSKEPWSWEVSDAQNGETEKTEQVIADLKKTVSDLRNEKQELMSNLVLLDSEHQLNTEKLINMKNKLQKEHNELEDKYSKMKEENESKKTVEPDIEVNCNGTCAKCEELLQENQKFISEIEKLTNEVSVLTSNTSTLRKVLDDSKNANDVECAKLEENLKLSQSENKILVSELQKAAQSIAAFEKKSVADADSCKKLAMILEGYEQQVSSLKEELVQNSKSVEDAKKSKNDLEELQNQLQKVLAEKEQTHTKYVNILTENMKKYVDCDKSYKEVKNSENKVDAQVLEFNHQVESILNILLDLKSKCESLENELYNASQEKTNILSEKNHEIEKLIQNSEILSQEVITKSQTIKDYENECNELIKNNDVLISELKMYKNSSGLQTISESNEDNLLLLESQLENANKRIEELEHIISQMENNFSKEQTLEEQYVTKSSYEKLLEDFNQLKTENSSLQEDIEQVEQSHILVAEEKENLTLSLEKIKTDLENTEYQYTEININMEILKEEIENQKKRIEELVEQKRLLEKQNMELERNNEDVRTELNIIREKLLLEEDSRKQLENQIRNLTEKLQNAKMCETSLKLQYDTVNKELVSVTEGKCVMETSLKSSLSSLNQCQQNLLKSQEENEKLQNIVVDLETELENQKKKDVEVNHLSVMQLDEPKFEENESQEEVQNIIELIPPNDQFQNVSLLENTDTEKFKDDLLLRFDELKLQYDSVVEEKDNLKTEVAKLGLISKEHLNCRQSISTLQKNIEELDAAKNELTNVIITKHQENVTYHNEIQRLSQILNSEAETNRILEAQFQALKMTAADNAEMQKRDNEIDKLTDQNHFLRQKCEVLAQNLLDEQSRVQQILAEHASPSEKEQTLSKKLERLQTHLIEVEEHYTQELLRAEEKNAELQFKVNEIELREKNSSTMYTSVSIRANQHVETLQHQLQLITNQRDELRKKISDAEDHSSKQEAALSNLQFVLEQFQKDKEKDVQKETERIRRQISVEKKIQEDLRSQITSLQSQLEESKHGLLAASRLSDQLEQSKQLINTLKAEVSQLKEKLQKNEEHLQSLSSQSDGKVDKSLIKNLVIGFVSTNSNLNKDQIQILKIIATVLDFNQQDHDKVNLSKPQQGWLSSFLSPQTSQGMSQESLSQAFVKFLENESKPRLVLSLLNNNGETPKSRKSSTTAPRQSPSILSEVVLPTFADFAQNRNSSSILKDVLKDNS